MIHRKVLKHLGCTTERLRQIATATEGRDAEIRRRLEDRAMSRITEGVKACAKNASIPQAVDIAWDSTPIQKETIPLLLWAQGKITKGSLIDALKKTDAGKTCLVEQEVKNADGKTTGNEIKVDLPRLYEMSINLLRSYVTRRLASQTARFSNLWPYFDYHPRGEDLVSKLRGDALSERMDAMADAYNYRHFFPQTFRHQFLYGRSVIFPRCAWDKAINWRAKDLNLPVDEIELESFIEREGVDFVAPHFSRIFWDRSAPLANINTDTGPTYIGHWGFFPFRQIKGGDYWNLDRISVSDGFTSIVQEYGSFFSYYFDPKVLTWPDLKIDPSAANDRTRQIGVYAAEDGDKGVLLTEYFEKLNPYKEGIAKLNADVWVRLSIAGDNTIVAGEFLPSRPACYGGLNENDDREINPSQAMELMGFQDQLTNVFSQMLMNIRAGMLQIWAIDKDALEPEMQEHIKRTLKSKDYYSEPQAFFYSGEKLRSLGVQNPADNPRAFLTIIQAQIQTTIEQSLKAAAAILDMADRVLMMAPNEAAQPNPREVAAREITEISTSTDTIKTFVSDGIDEQRAAAKRLCYESLVCESDQEFSVPVMGRYTAATIKEAGFTFKGEFGPQDMVPLKTPIFGRAHNLIYEYYFDSRDGADRPLNSQGAQVMAQLLGQFMQVPQIAQAFGKKRLFEWCNEIARMSGAPIDLKLELDDGEKDLMPGEGDPGLEARVAKIEAFITDLMARLQGSSPPQPQAQGTPDAAPSAPLPESAAAQQGTPAALAA